MFRLLLAGGPFMFATLTVSIITLSIFFWRVVVLWRGSRSNKVLLADVRNLVESAKFSKAIQACTATGNPQARILKSALMRADRTEKDIRRAVENSALEEIPRLKAGTLYLPQLSNLATLFGLIGTIHGLIIAFGGAGSESAATRQAVLSQGIAIAFYNTFFGLVVATMGIVFYLVLLAKMNSTVSVMEHSAATLVDDILMSRARRPNASS
jgi:biopolymer transport protein ExbB